MIIKRILSVLVLIVPAIFCHAQAILDIRHLENVRTQLDRPMYAAAYGTLIAQADSLLDVVPLSVMDKERPAPSGNNHDYTSLARYFWPDSSKADGLPYVNRDGESNPELSLYDRERLGLTANRVRTLALAYYFSRDERYAAKASELLKVWFLNPDTKMNPHFEYAQMVPGVNGNKGRCYGVLDGYSLVDMLDGVALLDGSKSWGKKDNAKLKAWMGNLLDWMLTSPQGIDEANAANNHSVAFDAQAIALAIFTGREGVARAILEAFPERRMFTQIEPDGSQPHEMSRTLSYHYAHYNLTHFIDIFLMGQKLGIRLDNRSDAEGRSFYKALDFIAAYLGKNQNEWPAQQLKSWDGTQQNLAQDLWRVASAIDTSRTDYKEMYHKYRIFAPNDIFTLLYYTPDDVDDAFVKASASLRYAVGEVNSSRKLEANAAPRRVSPRTVGADGSLSLVHPHDWTSGFFPGQLWMMYEFTNDSYWRIEAVSHTWPIEEAKFHAGTHDLGFMIGNSFGKAWELTGEKSYFDVVLQAARTLSTRFNPTVCAIRSWDHNAQTWHYPVIIDNMMNLEMLFKMAEATGDKSLRDIAINHADLTLANHFRSDHSSFHVVDYDNTTGDVRMKVTAQGFADDSYWSRGQGWGLYGYTMCYRFTANPRYLDQATAIADWWLSLPNMPSDRIPYWDMKAPGSDIPDNPQVPRDASAAAVIASALYELAEYVDPERAYRYRYEADTIVEKLTDTYTLSPEEAHGFILGHSTGHLPAGSEIDVPLTYADYYYLEALMRKRQSKNVD